MAESNPYFKVLKSVPAFASLAESDFERAYDCAVLRVLTKGECWCVAGAPVSDLAVVVSGRLAEDGAEPGGGSEYGSGDTLEALAFFAQAPASATIHALREATLLTFAFADLSRNPTLLSRLAWAAALTEAASGAIAAGEPRPARIVICPFGDRPLADGVIDALITSFEELGETRVLNRSSFGGGLPGALALTAPETAHWLHEQELQFDFTLVLTGPEDDEFARQAIDEADEVLFVDDGNRGRRTVLADYAFAARGVRRCRLVVAAPREGPSAGGAPYPSKAKFRTSQTVDFEQASAVRVACANVTATGPAVAAASSGVHAAAVLGALQAFEARGLSPVALAAAGSAILPVGLLAAGASLAHAETVFKELANPSLWRRSTRRETALFEHAALDALLFEMLKGLHIESAERPLAALSVSLSEGEVHLHRAGPLWVPVRAGLLPRGLLAPMVLDDGAILIGGQDRSDELVAALAQLTCAGGFFLYPQEPPLGASGSPYRALSEGGLFRLPPFQPNAEVDPKLYLEATLSATRPRPAPHMPASRCLAIPVAEGIVPMDWARWQRLRDRAFEWTFAKLAESAVPLR